MRAYRVTHDKAAISLAAQETAFNAGQTLDVSIQITEGDIPSLEFRREKNEGELTGKEEPDTIYDKGRTATGNWTYDRAKPAEILAAVAYALGSVSTEAAGTGYLHTITPINGDVDVRRSIPSFSFGFRYAGILDRKFDGAVVDAVTLTFTKDEFVKASATIKMSGKITDNVVEDEITAADNATSLTLLHGVRGSTAAERLDNVQYARYTHSDGYWSPVVYSAVSEDTAAAVLSITAPGSSGEDVDYKVLYAEYGQEITFPAKLSETPLKTSRTTVVFGGKWDGTDFNGGMEMKCPLKNVEWAFNNAAAMESCFGDDADYAGRVWRDARSSTLKVDREMRDFLLQQMTFNSEYFGLKILAEGAVYDDPHKYTVEIIFPRLSIISPAISADGKRLSESADIAVLEDDTYGSVIVRVKNLVPAVAA